MFLLISLRYTAWAVILQVWIYLLMHKINKILALDILNVIYLEFKENTYGVVWWYPNQFETYSGSLVFQHDQQWEGTHKFCWAFDVRPDYEAVLEPGKERVWLVSPPCSIQQRAARASCIYSAHLGSTGRHYVSPTAPLVFTRCPPCQDTAGLVIPASILRRLLCTTEDVSPLVSSYRHARHPHVSVMSMDGLQLPCHLSEPVVQPSVGCLMPAPGIGWKQAWSVVSRVTGPSEVSVFWSASRG